MKFTFSENAWTPQDVLNFWQDTHGQLEPSWQEKFLNDSEFLKDWVLHE